MNRYVCIRPQALDGVRTEQITRRKNGLTLIDNPEPLQHKGLVCVTENEHFLDKNLPLLTVKNAVLEGTDAVGKTSTIEGLIAQGIVCYDRDPFICQYMLFDVDMETRCKAYEQYLKTAERAVIFLINEDKTELERRVYSREHVSEFDKQTYAYNVLYRQTFEEMQRYHTHGKLYLIDCTGLTVEEQIEKVKQTLLRLP